MLRLKFNRQLILSLMCLIASIAGFWWFEQTTPARISALAFLFLVGAYGLLSNRSDVLGSCALFFGLYDVNQYLFNNILPIWLATTALSIIAFLIWSILFGSRGWVFAIVATLLATELMLAFQYVNIELKLQTLFVILPFIFVCQYYYFRSSEG